MSSGSVDSDGSFTPSERSDGESASEQDSDYETDEEEEPERRKGLNMVWTGYGKKTPVILFSSDVILKKSDDYKTVGERYHLAYKFGGSECRIVRQILNQHGFHEVHPNSSDFNLVWTGGHLKPYTLRNMTEFQKINHFPRSYELTRKDRLFKNIQRMQQIKGFKHFDIVPPSFVLPSEYQDFCACFLKERGPWIIKPVASSRGRGINLITHPDQVALDENLVVCKYINNPLLIDGFKFDVRLYVAVTSYDPLVIYLYEEGLTRFATVKYEKGNRNIRNQFMHLTNYSVNKKSQDYVRNDDADVEDYGNKWSMGAMLRYLRSQGRDTAALMMRIEDVVIKSIIAVELPIATACKMFQPFKGNCFELYGFDILIDDNLKPWVLEVNLSPSLACDAPIDLKIKSTLLCDLFSLIGLVCHDPIMRTLQQSRRNIDVTSKIASRSKSARVRANNATIMKQRPQSAGNSSLSSVKTQASEKQKDMSGLNSEEIKILRKIKEENTRTKGLVRIFPTADSWDLYSSFLQYSSTHNLMVHQRLYPERHKGPKPTSASVTSSGSRSKRYAPPTVKINAYLQITGGNMKTDFEPNGPDKQLPTFFHVPINNHDSSDLQLFEFEYAEAYAQAVVRAQQYERKLGTRIKRGKRKNKNRRSKKKLTLVQGVADDAEEDERGGSEAEDEDFKLQPASKDTTDTESKVVEVQTHNTQKSNAKQSLPEPEKLKTVADNKIVNTKEITPVSKPPPHESPPPPPAPPVVKYNVVEQLQKGGTLNKVQARSAFAMYLLRVQQRLMLDSGSLSQDETDALNEQMDLVLRFLKRAAVNLQQTFKVFVPSKKLPMIDRRRILAKLLGDFVHIYNKETDQLRVKKRMEKERTMRKSDSDHDGLDEIKFEQFINIASESELEEVLTTYTKLNKSASIFLGGKTASDSTSSINSNRSESVMSKRRDSGDTTENVISKGTDDKYKVRSSSHSDLSRVGSSTVASSTGSRNAPLQQRPSSAHHSTSSTSSYANAVSVYSQKLLRPRSASNSSQKPGPASRGVYSRPMSAFVPRPSTTSSGAPRATHEPTVDTFNDKAIHEALQKLTIKQQARQYSAYNGTSLVGESRPATSTGSREHRAPSSFSSMTTPSSTYLSAPSKIVNSMMPKQSKTKVTIEDYSLNTRPPSGAGVRKTMYIKAGQAVGQNNPKSWHGSDSNLTADSTFDSFVDGPNQNLHGDLALVYNQVTGVKPQNYNRTTQGSKQHQFLQQQQQMMEQSKELLEQSKAKHQAMIAQAHAVKKATTYTEDSENPRTFAPKPPVQPASHRKNYQSHRITRTTSTDDVPLSFNFYNSLKYDKHTGKTKVTGDN